MNSLVILIICFVLGVVNIIARPATKKVSHVDVSAKVYYSLNRSICNIT